MRVNVLTTEHSKKVDGIIDALMDRDWYWITMEYVCPRSLEDTSTWHLIRLSQYECDNESFPPHMYSECQTRILRYSIHQAPILTRSLWLSNAIQCSSDRYCSDCIDLIRSKKTSIQCEYYVVRKGHTFPHYQFNHLPKRKS